MLESLSHVATILGAVLASLLAVGAPVYKAFARIQALEAENKRLDGQDTARFERIERTQESHDKRLASLDSLGERLARIETKLDILMTERGL